MILLTKATPLDPTRASFRTHLNYIKCMKRLLFVNNFSATKIGTTTRKAFEVVRFQKLYEATRKSIEKDIELAKEDPEFAVIVAPWFPVKCYYALYYLESILVHLIDGSMLGFAKGGHTALRKKVCALVSTGNILFNQNDLDCIYKLTQAKSMPAINSGQNTRHDYWQRDECTQSLAKILIRYKLHDAKIGNKWNLRKKNHQTEKQQFILKEQLMLIDFFYWYRIKANYRDLDYIDFENGITANEVLEYIKMYYQTFNIYREILKKQIKNL